MNPTTATLISAAAFILAIFGAGWLNQQAMNKRIDDLKSYFDARFDSIEKGMNARFDTVETGTNARFDTSEETPSALDLLERMV